MNEQMNQWIEEIPMNDNEKMIQSQDAALSELRREILASPAKDKPRWTKKIRRHE